jgi:hypothetical protein
MQLRSRDALVICLEATGMSERQLARVAGLSHATVNHLVTGRRTGCERGNPVRQRAGTSHRSGVAAARRPGRSPQPRRGLSSPPEREGASREVYSVGA